MSFRRVKLFDFSEEDAFILGLALGGGRAPRGSHVTTDVVSPQARVRVPRRLPKLERPVLSNQLHVLRQTWVVSVCYVADLVRASTQKLACLGGCDGKWRGEDVFFYCGA